MAKMGKRRKRRGKKKSHVERLYDRIYRAEVYLSKRPRLVLSLLCMLGFIFCILVFDAKLSLHGDNAEFVILAKSIAAGQGMKHINNPVPSVSKKYPFGFPLLLSFVELISPSNYIAMKAVVLLLFILTLPLVYSLAKRYMGPFPALGVALFCITSPHLLDFSHQIMSEVPYMFFSFLTLLLLERSIENENVVKNHWLMGGTAVLMFSYYIRSAGISLVIAAIAYLLLNKKYKKSIFVAVAAFCLALPWYVRNVSVGGSSYLRQLMFVNPYHPDWGRIGVFSLFERVKTNADVYILREIPRVILPTYYNIVSALHMMKLYWLISILIFGTAFYGFIICLLRKRSILALYFFLFFGICLLWPQVWSGMRFIIPIIPLIGFFALLGLIDIFKKGLGDRFHPNLGLVVPLALIMIPLSSNVYGIGALREQIKAYPPNWQNYFDAGKWIKEHTPRDSIIACRKGYLMYLTSGRKTVGYAHSDNPDIVIDRMEKDGVDFVIVEQLGFGSTPRYLVPAINKFSNRFQVALRLDNPATYVLKFLKPS